MEQATRAVLVLLLSTAAALTPGCGGKERAEEVLWSAPVTSLEGVISRDCVDFDAETTSDGNGSIRMVAKDPTTARLFEIQNPGVDNARLIYRAKLKTREVAGDVYLEMWCRVPGSGEYFSRGLHAPITGTTDWTSQEIYFFLEKRQAPDLVKLNLVMTGSGTAWIDEVALLKGRP